MFVLCLRLSLTVEIHVIIDEYIPLILAIFDWRVRYEGLMTIAALREGTRKVSILYFTHSCVKAVVRHFWVVQNELGNMFCYSYWFLCCHSR